MFAADRNARGMNLREGWIGKKGSLFVGTISGCDIAAARIGREIIDVPISAAGEDDRVGRVSLDVSRSQAASDDSLGLPVHNHQIEHLCLREHLHCAGSDLTAQRLITTEQKLLAGLAARVKGPGHLRATEGTIPQIAAVFARKRHALRHALIDDVVGDFSKPVNVSFAGTKIAALNRVVEQSVNAVAIVLIIFRRVDPTLRCNRMRAPRRILETKAFHMVTELTQGRCGRAAREPAADDDDFKLSPVVWTHQPQVVTMAPPFLSERTRWNF